MERSYARRVIPKAPSKLRRFDHANGLRSVVLKPGHEAIRQSRTLFPTTVRFVEETGRVMKSGHNSRKIGKTVMKGAWRGMPIFTLTLQERATCPRSCAHWLSCYGNHMHFAERLHNDADFEEVLWLELSGLNGRYPDGFVVRLHVLGDFYSLAYVELWERALDAFPALRVFGYTARDPDEENGDPDDTSDLIGCALLGMSLERWDRFAMRFSGQSGARGAVTTEKGVPYPGAITCPAQTTKTECCGTCGLCWATKTAIAFEQH